MLTYFSKFNAYFYRVTDDKIEILEISKKFLNMYLNNKNSFSLSWLLKKATYHELKIK